MGAVRIVSLGGAAEVQQLVASRRCPTLSDKMLTTGQGSNRVQLTENGGARQRLGGVAVPVAREGAPAGVLFSEVVWDARLVLCDACPVAAAEEGGGVGSARRVAAARGLMPWPEAEVLHCRPRRFWIRTSRICHSWRKYIRRNSLADIVNGWRPDHAYPVRTTQGV